jgi:glycosyltransferase involved in cell wall biosynthesis
MAARKAGAAIYHTQYTLSPLARRGVTTIHDVSFFIGPEWFKPKDRMLMQRTVPASARRAKKVITVSETSKADIVRHLAVPANEVAVTYNAAPPWFAPMDRDQAAPALHALGVDGPYMLAIGARWPRKNLSLAIRAAELLPPKLPHKLLVVGKEGWGEEGAGTRTVATGYLANESLPPLYAGADLFVFPSFYEGFGIPMVEAFASGTPVLSSAGGSLPEVSAGAAEIVDSFQIKDWAEAMTRLLGDSSKLSEMRSKGLLRSKDFSWEETAARTLSVYEEVIAK